MHKPLSLAAFGLLLTAIPVHAQMSLPGKFEVTDTGSASYTIPISVVPGTAGLEPKLSLQYDSRSGNGLLGVGWSLAGLPAITRCGRTIAQDGQVGGVGYDANDRFCLDGQRLIATSGSYGADGTEYRTERESFSKVISYGQAGSGPSWFKVWTKAGLIMEFGNTADSRIEAQGKQSVRVWAINKTSDTKGNYFTVQYLEDNANGEYRPDRIDYTGNAAANTPPTNSVRFIYETRPDIVPLYQAGSLIKTTQRMTKVQAWQGSGLVREYKANYELSASSGQSRLLDVQFCDGGMACLPATGMIWSQTNMGVAISMAANALPHDFQTAFLGDFNGDGRTDILWCFVDSSTRCRSSQYAQGYAAYTIWLAQSDGSFNVIPVSAPNIAAHDNQKPIFGDFNGDGRTDILWCFTDLAGRCRAAAYSQGLPTYTTWLSVGDGSFTAVNNIASDVAGHDLQTPFLGDFNGDGKTDIFWCFIEYVEGDEFQRCRSTAFATQKGTTTYKLWLANGDGTFQVIPNVTPDVTTYDYQRLTLGDFNGDGRTDILWCFTDGVGRCRSAPYAQGFQTYVVWLSNGDGQFNPVSDIAPPIDLQVPILADFNGDGASDILWCFVELGASGRCRSTAFATAKGTTTYTVWLARGDGTFSATSNPIPNITSHDYQAAFVGDYNGDGRGDIFWCFWDIYGRCRSTDFAGIHGVTTYTTWLSKGDATFTVEAGNIPTTWHDYLKPLPGDYSGDGKTDMLWCFPEITYGRCRTTAAAQGYSAYAVWLGNNGISMPTNTLVSIRLGSNLSTAIDYAALSSGGPFYSRDTGASACTYPCVDVQGPLYVVSEVKSSNGLGIAGAGGEYRSTYRYAGAKSDLHGRGFLGFRQMTVRDEQTGVEQTTTYRQDYPFTGLVASREKKLGAQLLNRSSNTYDATNLGGTRATRS